MEKQSLSLYPQWRSAYSPQKAALWEILLNLKTQHENEKTACWSLFCFFPLLWEFTRTNSNILQERQTKLDNSHLGKENKI